MARLQFQLNLTGNFGAALGPVVGGLHETTHAANDAHEAIGHLEGSFGRFFDFDLAEGLHMAVEGVERLVEKFVELGAEIVKTAGKSQDLRLAVDLTTSGKSEGVNALAESFHKTTRFDDDTVKRALLPLLDVGITDATLLDQMATASADLAARRGGGAEELNASLVSMQKIALKGEVDARALRQLGVGEADFYKNLADLNGITIAEAEKRTKAGKMDKGQLLNVVLDEIQKREGGALGGGAKAGAATLGGTLQRFADLGENLFKKIAEGPGMKAVQAGLDKFIETMEGPVGTNLMQKVDKLFQTLGEAITPENIEKAINEAAAAVNGLESAFNTLWPAVRIAGEWFLAYRAGLLAYNLYTGISTLLTGGFTAALGQLALAILANPVGFLVGLLAGVGVAVYEVITHWDTLKEYFTGWWDDITAWFHDVVAGFKEFGTWIWQGLVGGITEGIPNLIDTITNLGDSMVAKLKGVLGIASPSRVFAELGSQSAAGFAVGLDDGSSKVAAAAQRSMADSATGGAYAAGRGGAGGGVTFQAEVHVHVGGGSSEADAEQLGATAAEKVEEIFERMLDRYSQQLGVAA